MSDVMFAVYGGGRWRQLCLKSGRVCGWGAVRVACQRRGRLELVPSAPALRALRALAQGRRSAARAGPRVPQQRSRKEHHYIPDASKDWIEGHMCCQPHVKHCRGGSKGSAPRLVHAAVQADGRACAPRDSAPPDSAPPDSAPPDSAPPDPAPPDPAPPTRYSQHKDKKRKTGAEIKTLLKKNHTEELWEAVGPEDGALVVARRGCDEGGSESSSEPSGDSAPKKRKRAQRASSGSDASTELASQSQDDQDAPCKELLISEDAVALLRGFLRRDTRNVFGVQLSHFDADDACKERLFYRLNPLVSLRRCPRVAAAALGRFADSLGLRRVTPGRSAGPRSPRRAHTQKVRALDAERTPVDDSPPTRRSLRPRTSACDSSVASTSASLPPNVSNRLLNNALDRSLTNALKRPPPKSSGRSSTKASDRSLNNALDTSPFNASKRPPPKTPNRSPTKSSVRPPTKALERPPIKPSDRPPTNSARSSTHSSEEVDMPGARAYAAAEDAHVLRFVCGAARARLVNGNRLWRALQPLHHRATGRFRSWQSLRNRYLRHLLPKLNSLLPPQDATRLRAAATAGELKASAPPPRRNSAFAPPRTRSAWGARARPAHNAHNAPPTPDAEVAAPSPARTPTYAQLTQRFADTSSPTGDRPRRTSLRRAAERSPPRKLARRLYNPNAM